ncbi:hypothetical protein BGZ72_002540 [Mortierella alpina]|nr:hypothetical protein BGZ72_002540 [Mortierella alpina]
MALNFVTFQYDSNLAIHLEGDVLPHGLERSGHPSRDHVLERKRSKEKKKAVESGTNWSQELERLGMTKAEVSQEFQRCWDAMAKAEAEFKEATRILERLEETRTLCRLTHKIAERDSKVDAYGKLKKARLEVALHRETSTALEKRYFELKEQVWIWSRLSKAKHPVDDKEGDNTAKKVSSQKRTAIDPSSSSHAGPSFSSSTAESASRSTKRRRRTKQQDVKSEHALEPDPVVQSSEAEASAPTRRSVKRDAILRGKRAASSSPDPSHGSLPTLKTVDNRREPASISSSLTSDDLQSCSLSSAMALPQINRESNKDHSRLRAEQHDSTSQVPASASNGSQSACTSDVAQTLNPAVYVLRNGLTTTLWKTLFM